MYCSPYYPRYQYYHCCYTPPIYYPDYYYTHSIISKPVSDPDSVIDAALCAVMRHVGTGEEEIEVARQTLSLDANFDALNAFCAISGSDKNVTPHNLADFMQNKDLTLPWAEQVVADFDSDRDGELNFTEFC